MKSLYADKPWVVRASNLSLLAVPFRPFLVSTANTLVMQGEFARQAMKHEVRAGERVAGERALGLGGEPWEVA